MTRKAAVWPDQEQTASWDCVIPSRIVSCSLHRHHVITCEWCQCDSLFLSSAEPKEAHARRRYSLPALPCAESCEEYLYNVRASQSAGGREDSAGYYVIIRPLWLLLCKFKRQCFFSLSHVQHIWLYRLLQQNKWKCVPQRSLHPSSITQS